MDQIGPLATNAADLAVVLRVIAGRDPKDSTSAPQPVDDYPGVVNRSIEGVRVGIPSAFLSEGIEPGVRQAFDAAVQTLEDAGASLREIDLPHARFATATYAIVATAEASSNLARFDGVRYGFRAGGDLALREMYARTRAAFGREVKRRVMLGTYVLSGGYYEAFYVKAQKVRALLRRDYDLAFEQVDVIAMPTAPTTAFPLGARVEDPLQMYLADVFTTSANLTGLPALSIPCGFSDGLPVGLQLSARAWDETMLIRVAGEYERRAGFRTARPASGSGG
jgi:aspartyl-tRNA(Asn)/glutamyl-tRNA(Gln) amidotransferase subunit A